jgi:hypothetical protein
MTLWSLVCGQDWKNCFEKSRLNLLSHPDGLILFLVVYVDWPSEANVDPSIKEMRMKGQRMYSREEVTLETNQGTKREFLLISLFFMFSSQHNKKEEVTHLNHRSTPRKESDDYIFKRFLLLFSQTIVYESLNSFSEYNKEVESLLQETLKDSKMLIKIYSWREIKGKCIDSSLDVAVKMQSSLLPVSLYQREFQRQKTTIRRNKKPKSETSMSRNSRCLFFSFNNTWLLIQLLSLSASAFVTLDVIISCLKTAINSFSLSRSSRVCMWFFS